MPKKLLIKSLSTSGELLNTVSCFAGQVSVLRALNGSGLKPYQRVLAGIQGPEKFTIAVDGSDYRPEDQSLIGFGERMSSTQSSVLSYLETAGLAPEAAETLLLSYDLENLHNKSLETLTQDEERRIRLLEATFHPEKILILNEPFEPIMSQWRERFAELLVTFARQKNAIVIVTGLSYRPEVWIDNDSIQRIQVGDSVQRTIGFGSAGSHSAELMNQIRDSVRNGPFVPSEQTSSHPGNPEKTLLTASLAGSVAYSSLSDTAIGTRLDHFQIFKTIRSWPLKLKVVGTGIACSLTTLLYVALPQTHQKAVETVALKIPLAATAPAPEKLTPTTEAKAKTSPNNKVVTNDNPISPPPAALPIQNSEPMILDDYPEPIKASLRETINGQIQSNEETTKKSVVKPSPPRSNIFKLLESANSTQPQTTSKTDDPETSPAAPVEWGAPPPDSSEAANEEQTRREAIRQKFLEAIRAAAERRQAAPQE